MIDAKPIIRVEKLVKKFGSFLANDNISFEVYPGEIFGFLGANGAGKTTAIRILSGLSRPTSGLVEVVGINARTNPEGIKKRIGYMSQKFSLYDDLTLYENIRFFGGIYGLRLREIQEQADLLIQKLGIEDLRNRKIGSVPLGWKQKLAFSVALLHKPSLVFLDEPTGGVDPLTRRQFWELIYDAAKQGVTIFVTTHYMDEAEYCDRLCILAEGQVKAIGSPEQIRKDFDSEDMDQVFYQISRGGEKA
ncbi:MAG: ABC transporter ATP-binding protein [Bacteroidales bacterium]|nr:ABC transporter ATP-binding protein [Bacteroidales bacterium]